MTGCSAAPTAPKNHQFRNRRRRRRRKPLHISANPFKRKENQGLGTTALDSLNSPQFPGSVTALGHMTWKRKPRRPFGSLSEWASYQPGKKSKG